MKRIILLPIFIFIAMITNHALGQVYEIESLQGVKTKIKVSSLHGGTYRISTINSAFLISNSLGINKVEVLKRKFLQITYIKSAGTGSNLMDMILVCVDKGKIIKSLDINSFSREEHGVKVKLNELQFYEAKANLTGDKEKNYKLILEVYKENKTSSEAISRKGIDHLILKFNLLEKIFYVSLKKISQYVMIYDPKSDVSNKQWLSGSFPTFKLDSTEYYFIGKIWYRGRMDYLEKCSY